MSGAMPREQLHAQYGVDLQTFTAGLPSCWRTRLRHDDTISWQIYEPSKELPSQGWKLHVAATATDALDLLRVVLPELVNTETAFKVPTRLNMIVKLNAGLVGASQVGKIVTAYPVSGEALVDLVERLDMVWRPDHVPTVNSDLPVGSGGALFIRYGVFTSTEVVTDSVGVTRAALRGTDGRLYPDIRGTEGRQPDWVTPPVRPADRGTPRSATLTIDGSQYLPLKVLKADLRGHVSLGLRLSDCQLVVIRHRVRGVESDEFGNDAVTRLENEKRALIRLSGSCISHELIAHDPLAGYLVVTDVGGIQLERLPVRRRLEHLPQLAATVAQLHAQGMVHRDLKLSNTRIGPGGLRLVDLELAAPIGMERPASARTAGYMPPEGASAVVDPSYDIYSLGSCVTHAVLEYCPSHLPQQGNSGRQIALLQRHNFRTAASIVIACHDPNPTHRPTAGQLAERLKVALPAMQAESAAGLYSRRGVLDRRWARSAAMSAGMASRQFTVACGNTHYWRSAHRSSQQWEGLNLGAAGIIIGLATLDAALGTRQFTSDITGAAEWLAARPAFAEAQGFFTGNSGVSVALAVAGRRLGRTELVRAARRRFECAAKSRIPDYDLFSGASGIVWAGCLLDAVLGVSWGRDLAQQQVARIRAAARLADGVVGWRPNPEYDSAGRVYLGAAHGTAGVAMALGAWGRATGCATASGTAEDAFRSVIEHGLTKDKSNILATTSGDIKSPQHWCHGVAGYLWCLLQGYPGPKTTMARIGEAAVSAFDHVTPILDNPTMCHGLAGQLETWRMLQPLPQYRGRVVDRIGQLTDYLRLLHVTQAGGTVWSSERPSLVTPDLWVGFLGPATQLALAASGSADATLSPRWLQRIAAPPDATHGDGSTPEPKPI